MSKRLLGWDGSEFGAASWWHEHGDGGWAVEMVQDTSALLALNREASNHCNPYNAARDTRMVARIPLVVIEIWRQRYGVEYWSNDPDMQRRIDRILDDPEWRWLRTDLGSNHSVLLSVSAEPKVIV